MATIRAVYENGVFRPMEPVDLPDGCVVMVTPPPSASREFAEEWAAAREAGGETAEAILDREIERLRNRTPEELEKAREDLRKASRPARPASGEHAGRSAGGRPGDDADDPIREALERLS